ncbi:MAG: enhanced intracellular survival protein Eis [Candidatus Thorarchaeota archaeon]
MVEVREAREEDRKSAVRVLWKAFESTSNYEDVLKQKWISNWHRPENREWAYVAVDGDNVVANLSLFVSDENRIRGRPVPFGGVWAVATMPHFRRKGLVKKLFDLAFVKMREEDAVLSILDPFYRPFYERFGYALAERRTKHTIRRDALRVGKTNQAISCREATADDVENIIDIELSMTRYGSRFPHFRRIINELIEGGNMLIFEKNEESVGTAWFRYEKSKSAPGNDLLVSSTAYRHEEVIPSIIEQVRNYAANANEIHWYADIAFPVRHYLSEIRSVDVENAIYRGGQSVEIGSMMMRVIDFEGYCNSINIPTVAIKPVIVELKEDQCPWNEGTYRLTPADGKLHIERTNASPDITLNPFQLSQVISGISPAKLLHAFNEIDCTKECAEKLEAIFPEDVFCSYTRF